MTVKSIVLITLLSALTPFALAEETAVSKPYIFFVQQDLRPLIDNYGFDAGFLFLMKSLPPEQAIVFIAFAGSEYREVFSAKAGDIQALPPAVRFTPASTATTPYQDLLKFLKEKALTDTTVYLITNGVSVDLLKYVDQQGPQMTNADRGGNAPNVNYAMTIRSPSLNELTDHCKKNRLRLVGFLLQKDAPTTGNHPTVIFRMAFLNTVDATKGKGFTNFTSFEGVFKSALKKYFLK